MNNTKRLKVYILDTNSDYRYVCSDNLRKQGFDVVGDSGDGTEALNAKLEDMKGRLVKLSAKPEEKEAEEF